MGQLTKMFRKFKVEIAVLLLTVGVLSTILGVFGILKDQAPGPIETMVDAIGNWYLWCLFLGPFLLIAGIYYISDSIRKKREFEELIETTSKAKFVKNLDRVEELAYYLTPKHQMMVSEKKSQFKIRNR